MIRSIHARRFASLMPGVAVIFALFMMLFLFIDTPVILAQVPGKDCSRTSVGLTPLIDFAVGEDYHGEEGGLYGAGMDELPPGHSHWRQAYQATLEVLPRAPNGAVDRDHGKIGLISIGMSNARYEFDKFMDVSYPIKLPQVILVNGAQPGKVASTWANPDPNDDPWQFLAAAIQQAGMTPAQVQVVWLKQANAAPQPGVDDFPVYARQLRDDMAVIVKRVRQLYPNVRLVYFSSRIYAGYTQAPLSPEPFAYEGAFSVRWLIQDQMAGGGDTGVTYANAAVLMWGPYLWADGTRPRSDGLVWNCEDVVDDGVHPSESGKQKVASMMVEFFTGDPLARVWFSGGTLPEPPERFVYLPITITEHK